MQACRAYYNDGRFVPLGFGKLPEGTQAIITLLDEAPIEINDHERYMPYKTRKKPSENQYFLGKGKRDGTIKDRAV